MIMKKISLFAAIMAGLLAVGCVQKEETAPEVTGGKKVTLNFELAQPQTKVAFDDQAEPQLQWTGTETMALVFGKYGEGGADNKVYTTLSSTSKGVFSGTIEVPEGFEITDLQGFVVPAENKPVYDWRAADQARIKMNCPIDQTQEKSGEPNWTYCPFFYDLSGTITDATQTELTFSGLTVKSASEMIRFNIYGKHPEMAADEVFESITLRNTQNTCTGTAEYVLRSGATNYKNNGSQNAPVVTLTEKLTIADKTSDNGIKVFMSFIGANSKKFDQITVVTNKATYVKDIETKSASGKNVTRLNVYQVGVDLSSGYVRVTDTPMYSSDGGNTWSETIPGSFTRLAVKNNITASDLEAIKTAIDAQAAAADLDLSGTIYESETFPATFAGTADARNTTLKSITFPVNVTIVSASAFRYCAALESVNLDEIVNIGDNAFRNTGLKKVKVDKQVKTLGTYTFAECHDLEDIYFNATDSRLATPASGGTDFYTFVFDIADIENHTVNMVATIGPDSRLPRYAFRYNANLSKIIFESTVTGSASSIEGRQGNNSLQGVRYLGTVITRGNNWLYNGSLTEAGVSLPTTTTKYLVVPDGQTETYKGWRLWTGNGTTGALEKMGFTMIEQSAYDALQAGDQN